VLLLWNRPRPIAYCVHLIEGRVEARLDGARGALDELLHLHPGSWQVACILELVVALLEHENRPHTQVADAEARRQHRFRVCHRVLRVQIVHEAFRLGREDCLDWRRIVIFVGTVVPARGPARETRLLACVGCRLLGRLFRLFCAAIPRRRVRLPACLGRQAACCPRRRRGPHGYQPARVPVHLTRRTACAPVTRASTGQQAARGLSKTRRAAPHTPALRGARAAAHLQTRREARGSGRRRPADPTRRRREQGPHAAAGAQRQRTRPLCSLHPPPGSCSPEPPRRAPVSLLSWFVGEPCRGMGAAESAAG